MTRMSPAQGAMLDKVARLAETAEVTEARVRTRLAREIAVETEIAWRNVEDAMAEARENGVPIRRLQLVSGISDFATIKHRIAAGMKRRSEVPEAVEGARNTLLDYLSVQQSPVDPDAWRITATEVPSSLWTYKPQGGDAYDAIPSRYSAYLDVDKGGGNFVSTRGHNSDPKGPLHLEWARGDKSIRDILKTVEV